MALEIPTQARWVFRIVVGEDWPMGNEDRMRELAALYDDLRTSMEGIENDLNAVIAGLSDAGRGPGLDAMKDYLHQMTAPVTKDGNPGYFIALRDNSTSVAESTRKAALEIEGAKFMAIGLLILVAAQLIYLAGLLVVYGPAAWAAAQGVVAAARAGFKQILIQLLKSIISGIVFNSFLEFMVELAQWFRHDRKTFDAQKFLNALKVGAIGGLVHTFVGWAGGPALEKLGGGIPKKLLEESLSEAVPEIALGGFNLDALFGAISGAFVEAPLDILKEGFGGKHHVHLNGVDSTLTLTDLEKLDKLDGLGDLPDLDDAPPPYHADDTARPPMYQPPPASGPLVTNPAGQPTVGFRVEKDPDGTPSVYRNAGPDTAMVTRPHPATQQQVAWAESAPAPGTKIQQVHDPTTNQVTTTVTGSDGSAATFQATLNPDAGTTTLTPAGANAAHAGTPPAPVTMPLGDGSGALGYVSEHPVTGAPMTTTVDPANGTITTVTAEPGGGSVTTIANVVSGEMTVVHSNGLGTVSTTTSLDFTAGSDFTAGPEAAAGSPDSAGTLLVSTTTSPVGSTEPITVTSSHPLEGSGSFQTSALGPDSAAATNTAASAVAAAAQARIRRDNGTVVTSQSHQRNATVLETTLDEATGVTTFSLSTTPGADVSVSQAFDPATGQISTVVVDAKGGATTIEARPAARPGVVSVSTSTTTSSGEVVPGPAPVEVPVGNPGSLLTIHTVDPAGRPVTVTVDPTNGTVSSTTTHADGGSVTTTADTKANQFTVTERDVLGGHRSTTTTADATAGRFDVTTSTTDIMTGETFHTVGSTALNGADVLEPATSALTDSDVLAQPTGNDNATTPASQSSVAGLSMATPLGTAQTSATSPLAVAQTTLEAISTVLTSVPLFSAGVETVSDTQGGSVPAGSPTAGELFRPDNPADLVVLEAALPGGGSFPDPRDAGGWAGLVNDGGPGQPGRANNCVDTSLAFVDTWQGRPRVSRARVDAVNGPANSTGQVEQALGGEFTYRGSGQAAFAGIAGQLHSAGHGAAAVVLTTGTQPLAAASHTWNAVNHNGTILWVDAQTGIVSADPIWTEGLTGVWGIAVDADRTPLPHTPADTDTAPESAEGKKKTTTKTAPAPAPTPTPTPTSTSDLDRIIERLSNDNEQFRTLAPNVQLDVLTEIGVLGNPEDPSTVIDWADFDNDAAGYLADLVNQLEQQKNQPGYQTAGAASDWASSKITAAHQALRNSPTNPWGDRTTLHHKVSRNDLKKLADAAAEFRNANPHDAGIKHFFAVLDTIRPDTGKDSTLGILSNMPANLEMGPASDTRIGDPGTGLDANLKTDGTMTPRSDRLTTVYQAIQQDTYDWAEIAVALQDAHTAHMADHAATLLAAPNPARWQQQGNKWAKTAPDHADGPAPTSNDGFVSVTAPNVDVPAGPGEVVTQYELKAEADPEPFARREAGVQVRDLGEGSVPRFGVARPLIHDGDPPLRVSPDRSLAINALGGEIKEFYASDAVIDKANTALTKTGSWARLTKVPGNAIRLPGAGGKPVELSMVTAEFHTSLSDVCRDTAQHVLGGDISHAVLRGPDGTSVTVPINARNGLEVTGLSHLADALVTEVSGEGGGKVGLPWAKNVIMKDTRSDGGVPGAPLPGKEYGTLLRGNDENARAQLDAAAETLGLNQFATAHPGEGYVFQSIGTPGPDGNGRGYGEDFSREQDDQSSASWGYHFAAVAVESEDGGLHLTLENYRRDGFVKEAANEAFLKNIEHHLGPDSESGPGLSAEQQSFYTELEKVKTQIDADPSAAAASKVTDAGRWPIYNASGKDGGLGRNGELWYFRAVGGPGSGRSFFDVARDGMVNPMAAVVLGGHGAENVTVDFGVKSKDLGETQQRDLDVFARYTARKVLWHYRNGQGPVSIEITASGNGSFPTGSTAKQTGAARADTIEDYVRAGINEQLDLLQQDPDGNGGPGKVTADHVQFKKTVTGHALPAVTSRQRAHRRTASLDRGDADATFAPSGVGNDRVSIADTTDTERGTSAESPPTNSAGLGEGGSPMEMSPLAAILSGQQTSTPSEGAFDGGIDASRPYGKSGGLLGVDPQHQQALTQALAQVAAPTGDGRFTPHPDPRSGSWAQLINDGGTSVPGRNNNCADTGLAFLSTWYGHPEVSAPRSTDAVDGQTSPAGETNSTTRQEKVLGASFVHHGTDASALAGIAAELVAAGPGSSALIITTGRAPNAPVSHTWTAVNAGGTVVWVDPQHGIVGTDPIWATDLTGVWSIGLDAGGAPLHPAGHGGTAAPAPPDSGSPSHQGGSADDRTQVSDGVVTLPDGGRFGVREPAENLDSFLGALLTGARYQQPESKLVKQYGGSGSEVALADAVKLGKAMAKMLKGVTNDNPLLSGGRDAVEYALAGVPADELRPMISGASADAGHAELVGLSRDQLGEVLPKVQKYYKDAGRQGLDKLTGFVASHYSRKNELPAPKAVLEQMLSSEKLWGTSVGENLPKVAAELLNVPVVVLEAGRPPLTLGPEGGKPFYVLRRDGNHFAALDPNLDAQLDTSRAFPDEQTDPGVTVSDGSPVRRLSTRPRPPTGASAETRTVLNTSDLARVPQDVMVYRVTDAFTVRGIVLDGFSSSHNKSGWAELGPGLYTGHNLEHAQLYDATVSGGVPAVMGLRLKRPANGLLVNDTSTTNDRKAGGLQHVIEGYDFLSDEHGTQVKFHPRFFHEHLEVDHVWVKDNTGWTKYEPSDFVGKFEKHIVGQHKQKAAESNANRPPRPERPTERVPELVNGEPPRDASPNDLTMIRYSEEAARFETRLAEYLAARSDVKQQVQRLVRAAWDHATPAQLRKFASNQTSVTGMVGPETATLEKVVTSGNLREQMALLYNGYTSRTFETMLGSRFDRPPDLVAEREIRSPTHAAAPIVKEIEDVQNDAGLTSDEKKQQLQRLNRELEKTRRTQELADQVRPPLSDAEWFSAVDREGALGWHPGSRLYQMKLDTGLQRNAHGTGGLVSSGTSGTAHGLMSVALKMAEVWNVEVDPNLVRLALIAAMISTGDHTYHEILRGIEMADPDFAYLDNWGRYWHLPPVSEAELREHVAEAGLFPDEHARSVPPTS